MRKAGEALCRSCHIGCVRQNGINEVWHLWKGAFTCIQGLKISGKKFEMADIFAPNLFYYMGQSLTLFFVFAVANCENQGKREWLMLQTATSSVHLSQP
jgi:hypothetical protein